MKNKSLGKGLGALFEQVEVQKKDEISQLPLHAIEVNENQVRKDFDQKSIEELAQSIKNHGLLEPIIVTPHGKEKYLIVAGERRFRAFIHLGKTEIPAVIKDFEKDDIKKLSLIENIQRENLNPIEEALSYEELIKETGMTQAEFAKEIGKSRSHVANSLRLLKLDGKIIQLIRDGKISFGHGKVLSGLPKEKQLTLAKKILALSLSVRETEEKSKELSKNKGKQNKNNFLYEDLEKTLSDKLMTKVELKDKEGKGKIEISYYSVEELTRLIDILETL